MKIIMGLSSLCLAWESGKLMSTIDSVGLNERDDDGLVTYAPAHVRALGLLGNQKLKQLPTWALGANALLALVVAIPELTSLYSSFALNPSNSKRSILIENTVPKYGLGVVAPLFSLIFFLLYGSFRDTDIIVQLVISSMTLLSIIINAIGIYLSTTIPEGKSDYYINKEYRVFFYYPYLVILLANSVWSLKSFFKK